MKKAKSISRAKYGYLFILPFFETYFIFSLIPLLDTIRYSFYEYYRSGLRIVGPSFVGFDNYINVMGADFFTYMGNTFTLWMIGFVPQIVIALLLASWFLFYECAA